MDVTAIALLIRELGYVIPNDVIGLLTICVIHYMRWQERKQDKDRAERMAEWYSMVQINRENLSRLMDTHQREAERMFKLHERNASALESLTHHLSILVKEAVP